MAATDAAPAGRARLRGRVEGTVQGVGFRPHVLRLARELGLAGHVRNDERGVVVEVEGASGALARFRERLEAEAPPLADVRAVAWSPAAALGERAFVIGPSAHGGTPDAPVTPDAATCERCLAEVRDPADRRHRYPFANCTDCGPRFTIVTGVPYDRPSTTMAAFTMCADCRREYDDPSDRRFHAQPNACPACGPHAWLATAGGQELALGDAQDAVAAAAGALVAGRIVAVKGIGGFHLACRADDEDAVAALRARKHREDKAFAVMVADVPGTRALVELTVADQRLLRSPARPIVLARRRADAPVAPSVAPRSADLGVMLPYSPLHHLLLADAGVPLVLTSGNVSDEPIAFEDADALGRLGAIADLFLLHDRPIRTRTDDSVVRSVPGLDATLVLRRSRGHVPGVLELPVPAERPVLACGAELKSTFCLARGSRAWVSHHLGDLENDATLSAYADGVEHFGRLFGVRPEVVAHDLHPEYLSTKLALDLDPPGGHIGVQHHHAHLAACLAEHGETGPAVGAILDGTGWGPDGTVWGGEILVGDLAGFERAGSLSPVRMPGGAQAIRQPWRMACAWLTAALGDRPGLPPRLAGVVSEERWDAVGALARTGAASPPTTSAGRLFDAIAALCGLRAEVTYEGQAAAELEAVCDPSERGTYAMPLTRRPLTLAAGPTVLAAAADAAAGVPAGVISARFHRALAAATADAVRIAAARHDVGTAVLSGGVFQNRVLLEMTVERLRGTGLRVLLPERLPPNDGGIAFGQAAVAAATLAAQAGR